MNYQDYELPHIDGLPLTAYGAAKLAAFEPEDLLYAASKVLNRQTAITPLTYGKFYNIAKEHCHKQGRKENWKRAFTVLNSQGFDGFKDDEPTIIGIAYRGHSKEEKKPAAAFQDKQLQSLSYLDCHSTCSQLKKGQRCAQTTGMTGYYRKTANLHPEGSMMSDDNDVQEAAVRVIENYQTEYGKRALKIFGWANPWFNQCSMTEQEQLLLAYPWIAQYIDKKAENPMLQNLADSITKIWANKSAIE